MISIFVFRISLITGNKVQFEYSAGKGPQGVTVETSYRLDDNQWHSILVERNRKEAMVVVDGARKGQVKEPYGPVRPMVLNSKLFIGATKDFSDGFVGCMRAIVLNGVTVDLVAEVTRHPWGLYGVGIGCSGKCSKNPCQNGGVCQNPGEVFQCQCPDGFEDDVCSTNIDECVSHGCINGYCQDGVANYTCGCLPGWTGWL